MFLWIILLLVPLGPMGTDIFTPSMPAMTQALHADKSLVQWSISIYFLSYSFGQIFFGTIADFLGRKGPLYIGLAIFIVGSLLAVLSRSIEMVLVARFIQGFGAASPSVLTKTMLGDTFRGSALAKATSLVTLVWGISPILAPALGGYLQHYFNWTASFVVICMYGLIAFLMSFYLPETLRIKQNLKIKVLIGHYRTILRSRFFLLQTLTVGCVYSVMQAFNVSAPFIIQHDWGYSPIVYGHMALIIGIALLLGALTNRLLLQRYSVQKIHLYTLWGHSLASLLMLAVALSGHFNLWALIVPTCFVVFFSSFIFSNSMSLCLGHFSENIGCVTSLLSFLLVLFTCLITFIMGFISMKNQLPLAVVYLILSVIVLIGFYGAKRTVD